MSQSGAYQDRILADRYARKDATTKVQDGDDVIVALQRVFEKDGEKIESRELGRVLRIVESESGDRRYDVALVDRDKNEDEWEVAKAVPRDKIEVLLEKTYEDVCRRVSNGIIADEPQNTAFRDEVFKAMVERRFIPAGRILAGLGCKDRTLTFFNCYVFPAPHDSRKGIAKHWEQLFDTFSLGGGIGWDNSTHRPRGEVVRKVNGRSSGAVSWMEQYSQITGAVEQGGSRRGASLQGLWIWHPDIIEFVTAKAQRMEFRAGGQTISRNKGLLENSNVSVLISDDFMNAVKNDDDWQLVFPDITHPSYDKEWDGNIDKWRQQERPIKVFQTMKAKELWQLVIDHAWESGEPGILFLERANKLSNSYYYNRLTCTNPCGEQFLPPYGICNLAHLNLSQFVHLGKLPPQEVAAAEAMESFQSEDFIRAVHMGVRFLDNVTDLNVYHDPKIEAQQKSERRVGLGILGYGEMLIRLGLRYGSEQALVFTDWLFRLLATESYRASCELAMERGPFPKFDAGKFVSSGFIQTLQEDHNLVTDIRQHGVRNVTLNTVAPTGSVGTMLNTTTGIEPYFLPSWIARSRIGSANEEASVLGEIRQQFGDNSPDYFVTTKDITPEEHVRTQATAQKWVDASISKTVNLPNSATKQDVASAYMLMYELGCKGGTVYRDESRDRQVLYYKSAETEETEGDDGYIPVQVVDEYKNPSIGDLRPKIDFGLSVTHSKDTPVGRVHGTIRMHPKSGDPYDMFLVSGKGDVSADVQALGRLVSAILRWPNGEYISQETRLEIIRDQLHKIPGKGSVGFGTNQVISLPDGIAQIIHDYLSGNFPLSNIPLGEDRLEDFIQEITGKDETGPEISTIVKSKGSTSAFDSSENTDSIVGAHPDICPDCGIAAYVQIPGKCPWCESCGYTSC